jgi:RimJ/RimL family protein N-acetyltransferase
VLERYRPGCFAEVKSFARHQPEFDYLLGIIKAHTREHVPGGVWVWREEPGPGARGQGPVVGVCGMADLNRRDAWLYGMRVDPKFKGLGIATRLTRALFEIAAASGRTWIGLDTLNSPRKAPVFRIARKLGMKLEGIYATAGFKDLPLSAYRRPPAAHRLSPSADWTGGQPVMFHEQYPRWLWSRIGLARGSLLPDGTPVQIVRRRYGGRLRISANLLAKPEDLMSTLAQLLGFAAGRGKSLVINYPADWTSRMRAASRQLKVPKANRFFVAWRIYGKRLPGCGGAQARRLTRQPARGYNRCATGGNNARCTPGCV